MVDSIAVLRKHLQDVKVGEHTTTAKVIENSELHGLAESLVSQFRPSKTYSRHDRRWFDFYLPMGPKELTAIPFGIGHVNDEYWIAFHGLGQFGVKRGEKRASTTYFDILESAANFKAATDRTALEKLVPWKFRTGRIRRKYVETDVAFMKEGERRMISDEYSWHAAKGLESKQVSLNGYLDVAAVAYRAAFPEEAGKSPLELYKTHADGRHGGMLEIRDPGSVSEYNRWLHGDDWQGSHPFEIVFSWHNFGIHFTPPFMSRYEQQNRFGLDVGDHMYSKIYIEMLRSLIDKGVAVETPKQTLGKVLEYMSGEIFYTVNSYSEHRIEYYGSEEERELYFKHIEWDELRILKRR